MNEKKVVAVIVEGVFSRSFEIMIKVLFICHGILWT